jgi:hypothetical protein
MSMRSPKTDAPRRHRDAETERVVCPRCGRYDARVIGRSESVAVVYLRCDTCRLTSVTAP